MELHADLNMIWLIIVGIEILSPTAEFCKIPSEVRQHAIGDFDDAAFLTYALRTVQLVAGNFSEQQTWPERALRRPKQIPVCKVAWWSDGLFIIAHIDPWDGRNISLSPENTLTALGSSSAQGTTA